MSDIHKIVVTGSGPARIVAKGASTGRGVPTGGSSGQVLSKSSGTDYDTAWTSDAGGDALVANPLSQFAATTSLQLLGVISDETGTGALVFANTPTLVTPEIGAATGTSLTLSKAFDALTLSGAEPAIDNSTGQSIVYQSGVTSSDFTLLSSPTGANPIRLDDNANEVSVESDLVVDGHSSTGAIVTVGDVAGKAPLNITARSSAPTSPATNDIYLDDGTGTQSGLPGWMRYTGSAWADVSSAIISNKGTGVQAKDSSGKLAVRNLADDGDAHVTVLDDAYAAGWNGSNEVPTKNAVYDKIEDIISIYTEKHATSHTISAAECYGGVHYATAAATITLPAVADGMSVTIITIGAVAVSVDPNASDLIYLDGVALDDGDKITNTSTAGDIAVLTYYDATGWHAATNGWTDGGA